MKTYPMNTAPKDGTPILVFAKYLNYAGEIRELWRYVRWGEVYPCRFGWMLDSAGELSGDIVCWMPMPPKPDEHVGYAAKWDGTTWTALDQNEAA